MFHAPQRRFWKAVLLGIVLAAAVVAVFKLVGDESAGLESVVCMPKELLLLAIEGQFKQVLRGSGTVQQGLNVRLHVNDQTGKWTVALITKAAGGVSCAMLSGSDWKMFLPGEKI